MVLLALLLIYLTAGSHTIAAKYDGDGKYAPNYATGNITVSKVDECSMNISVSGDVKVGNQAVINVALPVDATGKVTVNGKQYNTTAKDGLATITTDEITEAVDYDVVVTYEGDDKYNQVTDEYSFTASQINPTMNITVSNIVYTQNETVIINLLEDVNGKATIFVDGQQSLIVDVINGKASGFISGLTAGNHTIAVNYNGNNKYTKISENVTINVAKANSKLDVNIDDVVYDGVFTINATLTNLNDAQLDGTVVVTINGQTYDVVVKNGKGSIEGITLNANDYYFTAKWNGDNNYNGAETNGSFNVAKVNPALDVNIESVNYGEIFKIVATLTGVEDTPLNGFVSVIVNGEEYIVHVVDGKGVLNGIKLPAASAYDFTATWEGGSNYNGADDEDSFSVAKVNPEFSTSVEDIKVGEIETIKFNLPADATGTVTIKIGTESYDVSVIDGMKVITGLKAGNYTATVTYSGDNNYDEVTKEYNFNVSKNKLDMSYIFYPEIEYGTNNSIMIILFSDATGEISVILNGTTYPVKIDNGIGYVPIPILDAGEYKFTITFNDDDKYEEAIYKSSFKVLPVDPTLRVIIENGTYSKIPSIIATLTGVNNTPLNGTVDITIGKQICPVKVTDGKGVFDTLDIGAGDYNFTVIWKGNNNYNSVQDTGSFKIAKINPEFDATVTNIYVDDKQIIKSNLPTDATGTVTVKIGDDSYNVAVRYGEITIPAFKKEGNYTAIVTYNGDNNYNNVAKEYNFTVSKITLDDDLRVITNDVGFGEDGKINIFAPADATGEVNIIVDGKAYSTVNLSSGKASETIKELAAGNHTINIEYQDNDKYTKSTATTSINVSKANPTFRLIIHDVNYGKEFQITSILSGVQGALINSTVYVIVENKLYTIAIINGEGSAIGTKLASGNYTAIAFWQGNTNYTNAKNEDNFTVAKINPTFDVDVPNSYVGENETIKLNLPTDATGEVVITISDDIYTVPVEEGMKVITDLVEGNYTAIVTYNGDDNYNTVTKEYNFTVSKSYPAGDIIWDNVTYGSGNGFIAIFSIDAKGTVIFNINGTPHIL